MGSAYMSRVKIGTSDTRFMRAFATPAGIHGEIEKCLPGKREVGRAHSVWRIDEVQGNKYLLFVSKEKPIWDNSLLKGETKAYDGLLDRIERGQTWKFRLCLNPVIKKKREEDPERGVFVPLYSEEKLLNWLFGDERYGGKLATAGISCDVNNIQISQKTTESFRKTGVWGQEVTFYKITIDGVCKVEDVEKLKHALVCGVGREKAYGCGMLTITR
jgi:CRISPR system Cascade subunit CasE